jgi:hypothetical protein
MVKYVKLLDNAHKNTVMRAGVDGIGYYKYTKACGWVRSSLMLDYFCDESDTYDMYEEITEAEAMRLIAGQEQNPRPAPAGGLAKTFSEIMAGE